MRSCILAHSLPPLHTLSTRWQDLGLPTVVEVEAAVRLDCSKPNFFSPWCRMSFKQPTSHTTSSVLHWCPCCGQKCAAPRDTARGRDLLPAPDGLQSHTRWGLDFLPCKGLADRHHRSPEEAILANRLSALNSSIGSALLYSGERCPSWALQGQELDLDECGNPTKPWLRSHFLPNQAGCNSWDYLQCCFPKPSFFQLMPVLYGWTSLLVLYLYRILHNSNLFQGSPEATSKK